MSQIVDTHRQPENTILEMAQFSNQIPALPDEAFTRESLYEQEQRSSPPNNEPSASGACVPKRVLCFTSQIFGEFWNASTRPLDKNGLGLTVDETNHIASVIERNFELLPDSCDVHNRWRQLLNIHQIKGAQVQDTRLAASIYVHGITHLLTINIQEFQRFTQLRIVHPVELATAL